jgi:integrase/recombinase XerD
MSGLTASVVDYLALRRALGYRLAGDQRLLEDFARTLEARGEATVTIEAAVGWAGGPTQTSRQQIARRLSTVRRFADYLAAFDPATEVPPPDLLPAEIRRRTPYIFSPDQITALMTAAGRLAPPLRAATFATLIGLMAATGLRTGEAWRLDRTDVDLIGASLVVRVSKYGKTRQIPLHPSSLTALGDYARRRDRLCPDPDTTAFLVSRTGGRLAGSEPSTTFRALLREVGIRVPPGRRSPRLHDLRHTFAVATLRDWHTDGDPVQPRLAALSAYLGHLNPAHTYWYLQAVPELMSVLADRVDQLGFGATR